jgi:hypothetical protein
MDSILNTIKKLLGLDTDYTAFDIDVLIGINSALMVLSQVGVGPDKGFVVTGPTETWADLLGNDVIDLESVKMYVYISTKLLFDPPVSSSVQTAFDNTKKELEWRLGIRAARDKEA